MATAHIANAQELTEHIKFYQQTGTFVCMECVICGGEETAIVDSTDSDPDALLRAVKEIGWGHIHIENSQAIIDGFHCGCEYAHELYSDDEKD